MSSRRHFLKQSSTTALALMLPSVVSGASVTPRQRRALDTMLRAQWAEQRHFDDQAVAAGVLAAVEAAKAAGATYADACFFTRDHERWGRQVAEYEAPLVGRNVGIGVRALYRGYWGSVALTTETLTLDQAADAGRAATAQAKQGAGGRERAVDLAPMSGTTSGTWTTPVAVDPFQVSWDEKNDLLNGWWQCPRTLPFGGQLIMEMQLWRLTQTFASSEGTTFAQTLYRTHFGGVLMLPDHWRTRQRGTRNLDSMVSIAGAGWEYLRQVPFADAFEQLMAEADAVRLAEPIDVGRYDVVFDGAAVARLADGQLGLATELDRAMGYLANRDGTSYLSDPLAMLGNFKVGSPLLNVSANRSMPNGAATVKWDDEGVTPDERMLIKDGILTDFQTTRESANWIADYYRKIGRPVRSHGGAIRTMVGDVTQQGTSNLVIAPAKNDTSFEELCAGIKKGLAVRSIETRLDQQQLNAESTGNLVYEIVNGKLGRTLNGGIFWTRAPELWQSVVALGGAKTVCALGVPVTRQGSWVPMMRTVSAPAMAFKQVTVTRNQ